MELLDSASLDALSFESRIAYEITLGVLGTSSETRSEPMSPEPSTVKQTRDVEDRAKT